MKLDIATFSGLVDYATRYPEAVPLTRIDAETVTEALVDIYSRLGIPEEVLNDQGTQFISDCMNGVCKLLGVSAVHHHALPSNVQWFGGEVQWHIEEAAEESLQ